MILCLSISVNYGPEINACIARAVTLGVPIRHFGKINNDYISSPAFSNKNCFGYSEGKCQKTWKIIDRRTFPANQNLSPTDGKTFY